MSCHSHTKHDITIRMPWTKIIRYTLNAAVLALIFMRIDFAALWQEIKTASPSTFAWVIALLLLQISVLNLRWHTILNAGTHRISFQKSVFTNLAGYFANLVIMPTIGGVVTKSGLIIKEGFPKLFTFAATILDRAMTLVALLILSALSFPIWYKIMPLSDILPVHIIYIFIAGLSFASLFLLFFIRKRKTIRDKLIPARLQKAFIQLDVFFKRPMLLIQISLYSLVSQIFFIICLYIFMRDTSFDGSHLDFIALQPIIALLSALIPIAFGGWALFVYAMDLVGMTPETALLICAQTGAATTLAPFLFSGLYALWYRVLRSAGTANR
jgi:uncharacterized membrane protein YbhN (UPF0104 family)